MIKFLRPQAAGLSLQVLSCLGAQGNDSNPLELVGEWRGAMWIKHLGQCRHRGGAQLVLVLVLLSFLMLLGVLFFKMIFVITILWESGWEKDL